MSDEEPKSAWEIALEKLKAQDQSDIIPLTTEQKAQIAEIRSRFRAKVAEVELRHQSRRKEAETRGATDEIEKIEQQLIREKERLAAEEEALARKVRERRE